ncbi:MAG TPA: 5-deoxy-glucuronate isomerase, partial [Verrucomicrobiae bacterium]|nr:5-deoxy-glucuronate isomerase [Verrucomicrobiae bacterium]
MSPEPVRHVRSRPGPGTRIEITPERVGWTYLSFRVVGLEPGETIAGDTGETEVVIVPLGGSGSFRFGGTTHAVARKDVFT